MLPLGIRILTVACCSYLFLAQSFICPMPNAELDPTAIPDTSTTMTFVVSNSILGDANTQYAYYDMLDFQTHYDYLRSSCSTEIPRIERYTWPSYQNEGARSLRDNILFQHESFVGSASNILAVIQSIHPEVAGEYDVWTSDEAYEFLIAVADHMDVLIQTESLEDEFLLDEPDEYSRQFKKYRPLTLIYKSGTVSDTQNAWWGLTAGRSRCSIINTPQLTMAITAQATLGDTYLDGLYYRCNPEACSTFEDFLIVSVRLHEVFHHLITNYVYHHSCDDRIGCLMRSFNCELDAQLYQSQLACFDCWYMVHDYLLWELPQ